MKKFLIVGLLCFAFSATVYDRDVVGPSANYKHPEAFYSCSRYSLNGNGLSLSEYPEGVSDCVDSFLWDNSRGKYNDRCCYVRFQHQGNMYAACIGLSEENYLDTTETIRRMEEGDPTIWTSEAAGCKIYQLDCKSSYIKVLSIASILLALIL